MLRTTCFGCMSLLVSTCTSLTSPSGVATTRADSTPVSPVIRFSSRFIPHGSGVPVPSGKSGLSCAGEGLDVTWTAPPHLLLHPWRPDCVPPPWPDTARDPRRPARPRPSYPAGTRRPQCSPLRALPDSPSPLPLPAPRRVPSPPPHPPPPPPPLPKPPPTHPRHNRPPPRGTR